MNYFDEEELKKHGLFRAQRYAHPGIWYIYEKKQPKSMPKVIKEIPFEHVQMYRELQYENNPNIVKIIEIERQNDRFFLEMEYVQGCSIGQFIEDVWHIRRQSSVEECLEIVLQICSGLKTCHKIAFVHRDISENNVILRRKNNTWRAVLIDFGNCHKIKPEAVKDTTALGTIGYAAPEQLGFFASDPSTDIYAVGISLCRLLTGEGREGVQKLKNNTLRYIIKRCTRLEKEERYRNVNMLMSDLRRALTSFRKWEKKSNNRILDSFLRFMEGEFHIDYANIFLETPEPVKIPIYVVLMISMLPDILIGCIFPVVLLGASCLTVSLQDGILENVWKKCVFFIHSARILQKSVKI